MQNVSGILDVAIGLVFIYLLLSLICSALTEALENVFFRLRGKKLCEGLYELFGGGTDNDKSLDLLKTFYKNPLIYGLYRGDLQLTKTVGGDGKPEEKLHLNQKLPSYIKPDTFSLALVGQILEGEPFNTATLLKKIQTSTLLPESLKQSLALLVNSAEGDIHTALINIENWYSAMGERVSGWFKLHTQIVTFALAVLIAVTGNVDTITIANSLMTNDKLREELVSSVDQSVKIDLLESKEKELADAKAANDQDKTKTLETEIAAIQSAHNQGALCQTQNNDPKQCYDLQMSRLTQLNGIGLPISWQNTHDPRVYPRNATDWVTKILGLLITAIAVSLGAPFWFDLLNKFMNFRSAIKPAPKPLQDEANNPKPGVG